MSSSEDDIMPSSEDFIEYNLDSSLALSYPFQDRNCEWVDDFIRSGRQMDNDWDLFSIVEDIPLNTWLSSMNDCDKNRMLHELNLLIEAGFDELSDEKICALFDAWPEAVAIAKPLYCAIEKAGDLKSRHVFHYLLTAHPSSVVSPGSNGYTPLQLFFTRWNVILRLMLKCSQDNEMPILDQIACYTNRNDIRGRYDNSERKVKCNDIYEITILLLQAAIHGTLNPPPSFSILHAAIITPECPWSFVKMILKVDPTQAFQFNQEGNLPIHAIFAMDKSSYDGNLYDCDVCRKKFNGLSWYQCRDRPLVKICQICQTRDTTAHWDENCISMESVDKIPAVMKDIIATADSKIASIPSCDGMLPLNIAIAHDKSFEVIENMFKLAPEALSTKNMTTFMYSFMIAAAGSNGLTKREKGKPSDKYLQKFTCCFALLMKNPVLVSSGIPQRGDKRKQNDDKT